MSKKLTSIARRALKQPDFITIVILRTLGNFLVLLALFMTLRTFQKPVGQELRYLADQISHKQYVLADDADVTFQKDYSRHKGTGGLAGVSDSTVEIIKPVDPNYSIVIPKINANALIVPNVDTSNRLAYLDALKRGVAHAEGTANPGEGGHMFFFAHSTDNFWNVTRYNAVFYLLYKLENGDDVNIYYKGVRHKYTVVGHEIVDPSQVDFLTRKTPDELVTLQTCWPLGTTFKRYLVFAKPQ